MTGDKYKITVPELKRLLTEIRDKRPDICIRYRLMGEMWKDNFVRVIMVSEKGAVVNDEIANTIYIIPDLSNIIQFEIDCRFQAFQPFVHYQLDLLVKII